MSLGNVKHSRRPVTFCFWVQLPLLWKSFSLTLDSTPVIFPIAHYSCYNRENIIFCLYFFYMPLFWSLLVNTMTSFTYLTSVNEVSHLPRSILKELECDPILDIEHLHCKWWPKPESKVPQSSLANQLNSFTPGLIRLGGPKVTGYGCYYVWLKDPQWGKLLLVPSNQCVPHVTVLWLMSYQPYLEFPKITLEGPECIYLRLLPFCVTAWVTIPHRHSHRTVWTREHVTFCGHLINGSILGSSHLLLPLPQGPTDAKHQQG